MGLLIVFGLDLFSACGMDLFRVIGPLISGLFRVIIGPLCCGLCHEEHLVEVGLECAVSLSDGYFEVDVPLREWLDLIQLNTFFLFQFKPRPKDKLLLRSLSHPQFNLFGVGIIIMPQHKPHFTNTLKTNPQLFQRHNDKLRQAFTRRPKRALTGVENVIRVVQRVNA